MNKGILLITLAVALSSIALLGQSSGGNRGVQPHGTITPGHCTEWYSTTSIEDAGQFVGTVVGQQR